MTPQGMIKLVSYVNQFSKIRRAQIDLVGQRKLCIETLKSFW